jgi:hypothetical protein
MPKVDGVVPARLPWRDEEAEYAESYKGGTRKEAIRENAKAVRDVALCMVGGMIYHSAREGYAYSGAVGAVGRSLVEGVPMQIYALAKGPFLIAKDVFDIAAHSVAAVAGK